PLRGFMFTFPFTFNREGVFGNVDVDVFLVEAWLIGSNNQLSSTFGDLEVRGETRLRSPAPPVEPFGEAKTLEHTVHVLRKPAHQAEWRVRRGPHISAGWFLLNRLRALLLLGKFSCHESTSLFLELSPV